jgi:hypothetical protein
MNKKDIKQFWIIEMQSQYSEGKRILALLPPRATTEKIVAAMKVAMMANCDSFEGILTIYATNDGDHYYPHLYSIYPFFIAGNHMEYKAPYRAWKTEFNIKTGEYTDFDSSLTKHIKKMESKLGKNWRNVLFPSYPENISSEE